MKKVVCVGHIGGRCGTSMVMGLLKQSGFDVGNVGTAKSPQNAKGFFEIQAQDAFLREHFPFMDGFMPIPKDWQEIEDCIAAAKPKFNELVSEWFTSDTIAIKCPYYFPALLFDDTWEVYVVGLSRSRFAHVASIKEMNNREGEFSAWIDKWEGIVYPHTTIPTWMMFEEWGVDPYLIYERMCMVIDPPIKMEKRQVLEWYDPELIHYR